MLAGIFVTMTVGSDLAFYAQGVFLDAASLAFIVVTSTSVVARIIGGVGRSESGPLDEPG